MSGFGSSGMATWTIIHCTWPPLRLKPYCKQGDTWGIAAPQSHATGGTRLPTRRRKGHHTAVIRTAPSRQPLTPDWYPCPQDHPSTTPGPGVYSATSALGEQPLSPNRSPARVPFGSSSREDAKKLYVSSRHMGAQRGTQGPPPGTYTVSGSFGQQVASAKPTSPAFTLRKTDRLK